MVDIHQTSNPDQLLAQIINLKADIAHRQESLTELLDSLNDLVTLGHINPTFSYEDHSFTWSAGKRTFTYPPDVLAIKELLKTAEKKAVADGTAAEKFGAPYWTIKAPKS